MDEKPSVSEESTLIAQSLRDYEERNPIKEGRYAAKRIFSGAKAQITEIAFDADVELKEHTARTPILVQVIDGEVDFTVGGTKTPLGVGGCIFVEANVIHAVYAAAPARITVTFLNS
ncbi:cupin domain-containing protein [Glutamicibacter protophormiae]|uniref:cupin domain-containing protein n=1 Tax=Glutamicibacter protophormiae TaxID=37930 RepID=UPI002A7ED86A|nr:cupin domain-containing protein [Glutamicibacter protophormiae]WPR64084.1 cupin domain-containing protein [Glutamicibacter protophormiae]WPR67578.1 cupin domain-containing protein [Glutamicibacter protophormiae]